MLVVFLTPAISATDQRVALVIDFGERLNAGATGLFYYAGHGMQVSGRNFLIPVDAEITIEQRVRLEAVDVDVVLDQMQAAKSKVNMVVLDACRNNPFERRFRAIGGGLAQINAPEGTLIAYATAPGRVAADGTGENGLYTEELLRAMKEPGLKVEDVFKAVRVAVSRRSDGAQTPWEASSLVGDFYFVPPVASPAPPTPEATFWVLVSNSNSQAELQAFLDRFPNGEFTSPARARLAALANPNQTPSTPAARPTQQAALTPPAAPIEYEGRYFSKVRTPNGEVIASLAVQGRSIIGFGYGGPFQCKVNGRLGQAGAIDAMEMDCQVSGTTTTGNRRILSFSGNFMSDAATGEYALQTTMNSLDFGLSNVSVKWVRQ
jgi:hypothetical protein